MYWLRTFGGFSIERDGAPLDQGRGHRKAHALLAVLAAQGSTGRERLMALLWPESDAERAKGSLKQAIHVLRRELDAPDLLLGTAELRLNPERIESDVDLFSRALAGGDAATAVRHYGGPFLDGVHLDGTSEFERWAETQRAELARKHRDALEQLARAAEAQGEYASAAGWWRRLQNADPPNSRVAVNLMLALEASGDRAAALQHARIHETLLVEEWGITPDPAVSALAERLRSPDPPRVPRHESLDVPGAERISQAVNPPVTAPGHSREGAKENVEVPAGVPPDALPSGEREALGGAAAAALEAPTERDAAARRMLPRWRRRWIVAAGVAAAVLLLVGAYTLAPVNGRKNEPAAAPILAVGQLDEHGSTSPTDVAAAAGDMLATNLARVPGLQVVSSARMYEILAQLADSADARASMADAARRAGAGELLEGALHHTPDGALRLDLRRVDLRTGAVRAAYTIAASDVFQLVDRATAELAGGFGLTAERLRLAEATTQSLVAYRFYEEGLRSHAVADFRAAERLFAAALAEDTLFAMAAYYLWGTRMQLHQPVPDTARERVVRLADRAPDRERLVIRSGWAARDLAQGLAYADTLATRYPAEPDGHLLLSGYRVNAGDFLGALPHLQRVVSMDSLGLRGTQPRCRACDAFALMINAYTLADSLAAAERIAREWVRRQPRSGGAWATLAITLDLQGRPDDALAARRTATTLNPIDYNDALFPAMVRMRSGDFATADDLLRGLVRDGTPEVQQEALWWLTLSQRYQGRLREALATIRQPAHDTSFGARFPALLHEGQVLFELGRFAEAARTFHSAAHVPHAKLSVHAEARLKSWALTHQANALAAAGDTARLAALADTIEAWGRQSTFGRDWRLHHHVRGLLLAARGQPEQAVAEFRRAIFSPSFGYTRTNLELARVLLELGRPREAIAILRPALRGGLESSNLYVTRTDLHELLGHAWEAAGQPDSAAVHYRWVLDAWRSADPEFHARRDSVATRLRALENLSAPRLRGTASLDGCGTVKPGQHLRWHRAASLLMPLSRQ